MNRLELLKKLTTPAKSLIGSGLGNVGIVKYTYNKLVSFIVPAQDIVVEVNGCKLSMEIGGQRGLDSLGAGLILGDGYEIETTKLFNKIVKKGMNVVDIGAHIGYYTTLASKLVGKKGMIWAFEPEPRNYNLLQENIELNNITNAKLFNKAVGDENKTGKLYVSENLSGECSLVNIERRPEKTVDVGVVKLDDVLQGEHVDVVKLDVDGGEMGVLFGAKQVLSDNDVVMFAEFWEDGLKAAGYTCEDYWNTLVECGFTHIYLIDSKEKKTRRVLLDDLLDYLKTTVGGNILCAKKLIPIEFIDNVPRSPVKKLHYRVHKRLDIMMGLIEKGDKVLDIGCGTGINVIGTLKYLPIQITAVDNDKQSLEYAQKRHGNNNIEYVLSDGEKYTSKTKYDVIICSHILEHIKQPEMMLANMRKLLKTNGVLFVGIPNGFGSFEIENILPKILYKTKWGKEKIDGVLAGKDRDSLNNMSQHINFFTLGAMVKLLRNNGWFVHDVINEEWLGGAVTDRTILRSKAIEKINSLIGERLPHFMANGWILICRKYGYADYFN